MTQSPINCQDRHAAADRYAVAVTVPHIPLSMAVQAQRDMVTLLAEDRTRWLLVWAASVLHDLIATLPPRDPWRCLAGRTAAGLTITAPGIEIPEGEECGAWTRDGSFGHVGDSLDLTRITDHDLSRDPGLAPVADGLRPDAAVLLAAAGHSASVVLDVAVEMHDVLADIDGRAAMVVGAIDSALRWALHRRASYCGLDDPYPAVVFAAAQRRADMAIGGQPDPLDWHTPLAQAGQIDPDAYDGLRAVVSATR